MYVKVGDKETEKLQIKVFENKLSYGSGTQEVLELNRRSVKIWKGENEKGKEQITINHQESDSTLVITFENQHDHEKWLQVIMDAYFFEKEYCKKKEQKHFKTKYSFIWKKWHLQECFGSINVYSTT